MLLHNSHRTKNIVHVITLLLFILVISFLFSYRLYPYADDWSYASALELKGIEFLKWALSQHVDHFIPLQKIFHVFLAKWSGFDFRILILLNCILALLASFSLVRLAQLYRGSASLGDAVIPILIFNPASGYSLWAFQFQFLSSVSFFVFAVLSLSLYVRTQRRFYFFFSLLFLSLTALCGMNGYVLAIVTVGLLVILFSTSKLSIQRVGWFNIAMFALLVLLLLSVLYAWEPSGASKEASKISEIIKIFLLLQPSSLSILSFNKTALFSVFIALLLLVSFYQLYKKARSSSFEAMDAIVLLPLICTEALVLSIAAGRSGTQGGWSNVLIMHYGFLSVLIPIFCWIILSSTLSRFRHFVLTWICLFIFMSAFVVSFDWRLELSTLTIEKQKRVEHDLILLKDLDLLLDKHVLALTWKDRDSDRKYVKEGLRVLRAYEFPHYKLLQKPPFHVSKRRVQLEQYDVPASLVKDSQVHSIDNWIEKGDFSRSEHPLMKIYGSYVNGDSDTGFISFSINKGQKLLVKTGPVSSNQKIHLIFSDRTEVYDIPQSNSFYELSFNSVELPDFFEVRVIDSGQSWGEWSAVGLIKDK